MAKKDSFGSSVEYYDANLILKGKVLHFNENWVSLANVTSIGTKAGVSSKKKIVRGIIKVLIGVLSAFFLFEIDQRLVFVSAGLAIWGIVQIIMASKKRIELTINMNDCTHFRFASHDIDYLRYVSSVLGEALQCDSGYNLSFDMSTSNTTVISGSHNNVNTGTNNGSMGANGTNTYSRGGYYGG